MSDPSGIRKRIVDILSPTVLADMRFPDEFWAERRAGNMAELPEQPSEYWGPQHQPQWNHYPFTRVDGDEIEIGARSEHIYRVNVAEARTHAADLLAAVRVVESATEVTS